MQEDTLGKLQIWVSRHVADAGGHAVIDADISCLRTLGSRSFAIMLWPSGCVTLHSSALLRSPSCFGEGFKIKEVIEAIIK